MNATSDVPSLSGVLLDRYYHACGFFHHRDEAYRVLGPFIVEGLQRGEKALHITNPDLRSDHLARLEAAGVDVAAEQEAGGLEVLNWEDSYLKGGRFDPDAMLALLGAAIRQDKAQGYSCTRIIGDMGWALEDMPGVEQVMNYEARVNSVLVEHREPAICMYDLTRIDAQTMLNVLRTHPLVLIADTLTENPFFMPPDVFLRQFNEPAEA